MVGFASCELAIAVFAFFSKWLFYDVLYVQLHFMAGSPAVLTGVLFLSLLWPTFFMGIALPLLSKALTRDIRTAPGTIGGLYGVNTLGAAVGAFVTGWFLGRLFGFELTIRIGAAISCLCALGAILLSQFFSQQAPFSVADPSGTSGASGEESTTQSGCATPVLPFAWWILIYAISGFASLSLEIIWFRMMAVMAKPVAFVFANLLTLYLLGLAVGTFWGIRLVRKSRNAAPVFFSLQAGITLYAGLSIVVFTSLLGKVSLFDGIWAYFNLDDRANFGPALFFLVNHALSPDLWPPDARELGANLLILHFLIPSILIGPPTLMMGMSFPFLQKIVQTDAAALGRRVGWLQTANILGCTLGTVLTSWVFFRVLGTSGTLRLLIVLGALFLVLGLRVRPAKQCWRRVTSYGAGLALVCALFFSTPSGQLLWAKLHGTTVDRILYGEDGSGLCVVKTGDSEAHRTLLYLDGMCHSYFPYGGIHTLLGFIPAVLHPNPKELAVIGLASGDTAFSIGCRKETESITCFEIVAPQISTLKRLDALRDYAGLRSLLKDRRLHLILADGRAAIMQGKSKFDIIEADALFPFSAYSGNLYSLEYFNLMKRHLKPGGLAVTWGPTARVVRTFVKVFPHVLLIERGVILVGSNEPIDLDRSALAARLENDFTRSYFSAAGIDVEALKGRFEAFSMAFIRPDFNRSRLSDLNTDLYPKDEYLLP
jgi:spermidine synthase